MSEHDASLLDALNALNNQKAAEVGALVRSDDSFPVLKVFQEYVETERRKMRQRVTVIIFVTTVVTLLILLTLVFVFFILFSGMTKAQDRMTQTLIGQAHLGQTQPAPVQQQQQPDAAMLASLRASMADQVREMQSQQDNNMTKITTTLLELQNENKKILEEKLRLESELTSKQAPVPAQFFPGAAAPVTMPQAQPAPQPSVNPIRPTSDYPELDAVRARNQDRLRSRPPVATTPAKSIFEPAPPKPPIVRRPAQQPAAQQPAAQPQPAAAGVLPLEYGANRLLETTPADTAPNFMFLAPVVLAL